MDRFVLLKWRCVRSTMNRVLMISYAFPPTAGPGVQRAAKFAKYLPQFGWSPVVWAADDVPDLPRDPTWCADELGDTTIYRTSSRRLVPQLVGVWRRIGGATSGVARVHRAWRRLDWRVGHWLDRAAHWSIPDTAAAWALASVGALRRLVNRERIDAIWSTYAPPSNHLPAWLLHRSTRLPWIADFRDLWTDDFSYAERSRVRRAVHRWLERRFLESARFVVGATPEQTEVLTSHAMEDAGKFVTITNGADEDDFALAREADAGASTPRYRDRCVFAYVGSFVSTAEPFAMIDGYRRLLDRLGDDAGRCEFRIVGSVPAPVLRYIERSGVRPTITGYVRHLDAIRHMLDADALLSGNTTEGNHGNTIVPAKVYEYLASGKPIIHVGAIGGAVDRLLSECQTGVTVSPTAAGVCEALFEHWQSWSQGRPPRGCSAEARQPYERRELTRQLAGLLDAAIGVECEPGILRIGQSDALRRESDVGRALPAERCRAFTVMP